MTLLPLALALAAIAPPVSEIAPPPGEPLAPFFLALEALEAGGPEGVATEAVQPRVVRPVVRIAWWGDSAIVSDGYTSVVRERLQARFGDAGPGFVLAAWDFGGYRRHGLRLRSQGFDTSSVLHGRRRDGLYGYGGLLASSWGGASLTATVEGEPIDRVLVFHRAGPGLGRLRLVAEGPGDPEAEVETASEVEEDRAWEPALPGPATSVRLQAAGGGPVKVFGVAFERARPGVVLDTLGVQGLRARRWRDEADEAHLRGQVRERGLSLVVLAFGGNERADTGLSKRAHREEMIEVIRRFREPADVPCLVVSPLAHGRSPGAEGVPADLSLDPMVPRLTAAQREAAESSGCAFLDTTDLMGGKDAVRRFRERRLLGGDLAHLNGRGHRVLGDLVATWILDRYDRWKAARSVEGEVTAEVPPPAPPESAVP